MDLLGIFSVLQRAQTLLQIQLQHCLAQITCSPRRPLPAHTIWGSDPFYALATGLLEPQPQNQGCFARIRVCILAVKGRMDTLLPQVLTSRLTFSLLHRSADGTATFRLTGFFFFLLARKCVLGPRRNAALLLLSSHCRLTAESPLLPWLLFAP